MWYSIPLCLVGCVPPASTLIRPTLVADSIVAAGIAAEESLDPAAFAPRSVGVLPLRVESPDSALAPLGHGLAVLLMTDLARSQQVQVVDRLVIDALLREVGLAGAGVIQPTGAPRAGRILGARYLVLGSVGHGGGDDLILDARLAATEDGSVRPAITGTASVDEILEAEKVLAFGILEALEVSLTPAERAVIEQRPTRSLAALLAFSRGARAESELRLLEALREYREALRIDPTFPEALDRVSVLDTFLTDPFQVGALAVDVINRPSPQPVPDIADPAFQGGSAATLIIPIVVR